MATDSGRTVSSTFKSKEEKEYYNEIAVQKGYGNLSTMMRVGLFQMLGRMKVPTFEENQFSDRDSKQAGEK